jgi:cell division protein FtsQ
MSVSTTSWALSHGSRNAPCGGEVPLVAGKDARGGARPKALTTVVPIARATAGFDLARFLPSARSLGFGLALLAAAAAAYGVARGTSAFAVRELAVTGAPAHVAVQARETLAGVRGESLLSLDLGGLEARLEAVPTVAAVSFDRGFPHTLTVAIVPERPVAVLRRGAESWLVAASGRVIAQLERGARAGLPRIWIARTTDVRLGAPVVGDVRRAVRAVAPLVRRPLPTRVTAVRATEQELTLVLRAGFQLRLGDESDRALKLELARRILPSLLASGGYLDVSVPERPVAATTLDSQVEVEPSLSNLP